MGLFNKFVDFFVSEEEKQSRKIETEQTPESVTEMTVRYPGEKQGVKIRSDAVLRTVQSGDGQVSIEILNPGGAPLHLIQCQMPEGVSAQKELLDLYATVISDLKNALLDGRKDMVIPRNQYDLIAYSRRRPSIQLDFTKLQESVSSGTADAITTRFMNSVRAGSRMDVFFTRNSLSAETAAKILQNSFRPYPNVHFIEIYRGSDGLVFWNNPKIVQAMRTDENVVAIGVGILGKTPQNCLKITDEDGVSAIRQASALTDHTKNIREEMIDYQVKDHADGVIKAGRKWNKEYQFILKTMRELAVEEASYRMPESEARSITTSVMNSMDVERSGVKIVRVARFDRTLILNLIPDAKNGFLVEESNGIRVYYHDVTGQLVKKYGWIPSEPDWCRAPDDLPREDVEMQADQAANEYGFVQDLDHVLKDNDSVSASASYYNLQRIVEKYADMKMSSDQLIRLLDESEEIKKQNLKESVSNMIRDAYKEDSEYMSFGKDGGFSLDANDKV